MSVSKKTLSRKGLAVVMAGAQGVPLTHANLAASLANIVATYELTPRDRSLLVMPLFHVHGLMAGTALHPRPCVLPIQRLLCSTRMRNACCTWSASALRSMM